MCVVDVANLLRDGIERYKLAGQNVAVCSIDGLVKRLVAGPWNDTFQCTTVVVGRSDFLLVFLRLSYDSFEACPVYPWWPEQKGFLVEHCLEEVLLVEHHMHEGVQEHHPYGQ